MPDSLAMKHLIIVGKVDKNGFKLCTSGHGLVSHCQAMDRPYTTFALLAIEILFFVKNKYTQSNIKYQINIKHVGT
jgi:hypothetical protein